MGKAQREDLGKNRSTGCTSNADCASLGKSFYCDSSTSSCETCSVNICQSTVCGEMSNCWSKCCVGLCKDPEYPCPTGEYCYEESCLPCPASCGTWQGSCPEVCPHTTLSIGNIGFFSVALVLVICSCCFCLINTARRLYYRRRAAQYRELLNQPLIVDDDGEIEGGGPWDCPHCRHHNRLPTRTCDACGEPRPLKTRSFEVESDAGDDRDRPRRTIWGWEITSEGAIRWLRRLSRGSPSEEEDEEVNVVARNKESKIDADDDDESNDVRIHVSPSRPRLDLSGWVWEMSDPTAPPRHSSHKHDSDNTTNNSTKEDDDDDDVRVNISSNRAPSLVLRAVTPSTPLSFPPLPSYVAVTPSDIAAASKLTLGKKMQWFRVQLSNLRIPWDEGHVKVEVRRDAVLSDALTVFENVCVPDHDDATTRNTHKIFRFEFLGEPAVDAGGVAREFFELTVDALFRPDFALFERKSMSSYWICGESSVAHPHGEDRRYMRFAGRLLGKALFDGHTTGAYLSRALLKHILRRPIGISDLQFVDKSVWDMYVWLNRASDKELEECELDFTVTTMRFGKAVVVDLKPNGSEITVSRSNIVEFLRRRAQYTLMDSVSSQLYEFVQGFYDVIPPQLLMVFDAQELELMLCGLPTIDVNDWRTHTQYRGVFSAKHRVTGWFFEYLVEIDDEKRARLLQFITGTSRVPVSGFRCLQSYDGKVQRFTLQSVNVRLSRSERRKRRKANACKRSSKVRNMSSVGELRGPPKSYVSYLLMPKAHTCFNRLDLPVYKTKAELATHLDMALNSRESVTGFGMD